MAKWSPKFLRRIMRLDRPGKAPFAKGAQNRPASWIGKLKELPVPSDPTVLRPMDLARFLENESQIFPNLHKRLFQPASEEEFWHAKSRTPNVTGNLIRDSGMWDQARIMREKQEEITQVREGLENASVPRAKQTGTTLAKIRAAQGHATMLRKQHATDELIRRAKQQIRTYQDELERIPEGAFQRNLAIETNIRHQLDQIQMLENQIAASKKKARAYLVPAIQELNKKKPPGKTHLLYSAMTPARALGEFLEEEKFFSFKRMIVLRQKLHEAQSGKRKTLFHPGTNIPRITGDPQTDRKIANSAVAIFSLRNSIRKNVSKAAQANQTPEQQEKLLELARKMEEHLNSQKYFIRLQLLANYQNGH